MTTPTSLTSALADRYLIEKELGQGGMATVYLATDVRHSRKVAIKVLRPELAAVIGAERFVREIQTIATLQHPHILGLIDSGEVQGTAYYVMPLVEGESLRDRLARDKQLPVDDALRITTEVAAALDYAHRHGVIHRDIKPENILLHDGSALVADFGIALAVSTAGTRMTETGMSLGTPHYMSPEQAMGQREVGPRSDVYALGCVLYEMLIGEPPFTGPTAQAIVARVLTEPPRPIAVQRKSVPEHVEATVRRALEKLPADRFGTAREFADALAGKATLAVPSASPRASGMSRGRLWAIGAATLALGAMLGVLASQARGRIGGAPSATSQWIGELLGGPDIAAAARVSPDGQSIAFQAMIDGQTQIGILRLGSGDWSVLTHDRTRGIGHEQAWSYDGTKIYFSRYFEVPRGIWSISPLGGDERLVLEEASNPEPLPDGSLLFARVNGQQEFRLSRYWPETSRVDTLDAFMTFNWNGSFVRPFPDGKRAIYWGHTARDSAVALRIIDLATGQSRLLAKRLPNQAGRGFAFSPDGRWVVLVRAAGNLLESYALATDGSGRERSLYSMMTDNQWSPDVGPDGSLYLDEMSRPLEIHRYRPADGKVERTPASVGETTLLSLPDGRMLIVRATAVNGGSTGPSHVMVVTPGKEVKRFVQTDAPTVSPMALVGADQVLVRTQGGDGKWSFATVSIATGRILGRVALEATSIAGCSPDGKTVYFVRDGQVFSRDLAGGAERRLAAGIGAALAPNGEYLVVTRVEQTGVRILRYDLRSGQEVEIPIRRADGLNPAPTGLTPNAIGRDGRIALQVVSPASWFWPAGILDPSTGQIALTPSGVGYDMTPGWTADGSIVSAANPLQARMWRLKPAGGTPWWK